MKTLSRLRRIIREEIKKQMNEQLDVQSMLSSVRKFNTTLGIGVNVNKEIRKNYSNTGEQVEASGELNSQEEIYRELNSIKSISSKGVSVVADCTMSTEYDTYSVDTVYVTGNQADVVVFFVSFCKKIWGLSGQEIEEYLTDEAIGYSAMLRGKLTPVKPQNKVQRVSSFNQIQWPEEDGGETSISVMVK